MCFINASVIRKKSRLIFMLADIDQGTLWLAHSSQILYAGQPALPGNNFK